MAWAVIGRYCLREKSADLFLHLAEDHEDIPFARGFGVRKLFKLAKDVCIAGTRHSAIDRVENSCKGQKSWEMMIDRGKENAYFRCKVDCCEFEISGGDGSKNSFPRENTSALYKIISYNY